MKKIFYLDDLKTMFFEGYDAKIISLDEENYLVRADAWTDKQPILELYQADYFDCENDDRLYMTWLNDILTDFGFNFKFI